MVVLTEKMGMFLCQFVCCAFATKATAKNPAQEWPYNSGFIFPGKFNLYLLFLFKYINQTEEKNYLSSNLEPLSCPPDLTTNSETMNNEL